MKTTTTTEDLVRITFDTRQHELTTQETTARESLKATIELAIEKFQLEYPKTDVMGIELYPCDCGKCGAEAA
jgi:hypothetical protein